MRGCSKKGGNGADAEFVFEESVRPSGSSWLRLSLALGPELSRSDPEPSAYRGGNSTTSVPWAVYTVTGGRPPSWCTTYTWLRSCLGDTGGDDPAGPVWAEPEPEPLATGMVLSRS